MDYQLQVVDAHSDDGGGLPRAAERDLTIIFEYFAARGTGRAMGMSTKGVIMMESRNLMRLFRDAGMIHRPGRGPLTSARIDLIFTQVISDHARRHADNSVHDAKHAKIGRDLPGLRGKGVQKKKKVVPRKIEFAQFMEVLERCAGIMRRPFMSLVEEIVNSRGGHSAAHHMLGDSPASKGTPYTRRMSAAGKSLLAQHLESEHYVLDQEPQMQLGNGDYTGGGGGEWRGGGGAAAAAPPASAPGAAGAAERRRPVVGWREGSGLCTPGVVPEQCRIPVAWCVYDAFSRQPESSAARESSRSSTTTTAVSAVPAAASVASGYVAAV
jgi:hypothetical protein